MNTIFIGGSRHVSRLPVEVKQRLDNVIRSGHRVVVGDSNGADKAVQKYFHDAAYDRVTVFCSGRSFRNNLGHWTTRNVDAPKHLKGFHFYAAKDREMAREADFGLMIWDGKSTGTVLNVLRLVRAGKIAVLFSVRDKRAINIKTATDWESFLNLCSDQLRRELRDRATPDEWQPEQQPSLLDAPQESKGEPEPELKRARAAGPSESELADILNAALANAEPAAFVDALGGIAKMRGGMSHVAKDTGLARESLYRALSGGGNPEFATVLKVMSAVGLRLRAEWFHGQHEKEMTMSKCTVNTTTALQRLVTVARRDQTGDLTAEEAMAIVREWRAAVDNDPSGLEQVQGVVADLWQSRLPAAAKAEHAAGFDISGRALERAIAELRKPGTPACMSSGER